MRREQAAIEIARRWPAVLQAVVPSRLAPSERDQLLDSTPRLVTLATGASRLRDQYSGPLTLILTLTLLLLGLASVNVGGLLLARMTARSGELSVRMALGGTRWRIAQQMVVESLMLSIAGAALAVPVAYGAATLLASLLPPANVPYRLDLAPTRACLPPRRPLPLSSAWA